MGRVYLGFSPAGRAVAIKVIHPELAHDETFRSRFRREVAAARQVSGAYTAPVVAAGLDGDRLWLATAFVAGPSLAAAVSAQGPFPEAPAWRLAAGLAEALGAVHACRLVHRDLKPANVLLASDGPRLIDFGIARALDGTAITASGHIVGTPAFMSPEQAEGLDTGPASDVFSLASVLAFAASGTPPFGTDRPATTLYRVVHAEPGAYRSPALRTLIAACLAKQPAARPALADLTGAIAAHWSPSGAGPPGEFWPETLAGLVRSYEAAVTPAAETAGPAGPGIPTSVKHEYSPAGAAGQPGADGQRDEPGGAAGQPGADGQRDEPGGAAVATGHGAQPARGHGGRAPDTVIGQGAPRGGGTHRVPRAAGTPSAERACRGPGRRQVLSGLGVLSAAALGVAGWEPSRGGASGPPRTGGHTTPPRTGSGATAGPAGGTGTGAKVWSVRLGTANVSVPLVAGSVVYAGPVTGSSTP